MATGVTKRLTSSVVLMSVLFSVLVASLYILSNTAENLDRFGQYYFWLLLTDAIVLLFISVLIGSNSLHLMREFRQRVAGSRLTVKLIAMSIFLALVPVSLVYSFSVKFLRINIDSLSNVSVEEVMDDALELSRVSLNEQTLLLKRLTVNAVADVTTLSKDQLGHTLETFSEQLNSNELMLMNAQGEVLASMGRMNQPSQDISSRVVKGIVFAELSPTLDDSFAVRVVVPISAEGQGGSEQILQVMYPISGVSRELADNVQESFRRYQQMVFLSKPLKLGSILTLSLALLLSVLTALWFAFYAVRRMMVPIHNLVEGTRQVADGDYSIRIYKHGDDELRYLVESFNDMTERLEKSRDLASQSRDYVESQRAYLETVLTNVSTGVITFDTECTLRTANDAAGKILGSELFDGIGHVLTSVVDVDSLSYQFYSMIKPNLGKGSDWSSEIEVLHTQGRRLILCRGTQLFDMQENLAGTVVVFDDITTLMQAQRNAAWSEVARRLAHEIKNPLTPIQLAAERLRHKYLNKMQGQDAELMDRLTHTITQQVESMKAMVKAFADYANTPTANFVQTDVNRLILEVADLYDDMHKKVELSLELGTNLPMIPADGTRLRQLLHNLIKNAIEAQADSDSPRVAISTLLVQTSTHPIFELRVDDHGAGIPVELLEKLFEPYVTSKPKGTGLGLAIVKKIVEEHNGVVSARNREQGGSSMVIQLMLPSDSILPLEV